MATTVDIEQEHAGWDPLDPGGIPVTTGRYQAATLPLHGGALCLDFTNTAVWRMRPRPEESLATYDDILAWTQMAGGIDDETATALRAAAAASPSAAAAIVSQAIALREALYRVFLAAMADVPPADPALATVNDALRDAMAHAVVLSGTTGLTWDWPPVGGEATALTLERPLWPIARSAADLLTGDDLARVKRCPGDGCGWLFLDTSRNASRRWCDMASCGNRARVRAFAARKRGRED